MIRINESSHDIIEEVMNQYNKDLKEECHRIFGDSFAKIEYETDYKGDTVIAGNVSRKFGDTDIVQRVDMECPTDGRDRVFQLRGMNSTGKTTAALAIAMYLGFDFEKYEEFIRDDNRDRMRKMLHDTSIELEIQRGEKTFRIKRGREEDMTLQPDIVFQYEADSSKDKMKRVHVDSKDYEDVREGIVSAVSRYIDIDFIDSERELRRNVMTTLRTMLYDDLQKITDFMVGETERINTDTERISLLIESIEEYSDQIETKEKLLKNKKTLEAEEKEMKKKKDRKINIEKNAKQLEGLASRFASWREEYAAGVDLEDPTVLLSEMTRVREEFISQLPETERITTMINGLIDAYSRREATNEFADERKRILLDILYKMIQVLPEDFARERLKDLSRRLPSWNRVREAIQHDETLSTIDSLLSFDFGSKYIRKCDIPASLGDVNKEVGYTPQDWKEFLVENKKTFKLLEMELPKNPNECSERIEDGTLEIGYELEILETDISDYYENLSGIEEQIKKTEEESTELAKKIEESMTILGLPSETSFEYKDVKRISREVQKMREEKELEKRAVEKIKIDAMNIQSMFEKDNLVKLHEYGFKNYGKERIDHFIERIEEDSMFKGYISRLSEEKSLIPIFDALNSVFKNYLGKHFHFDIESEKVHQAEIKKVDLFEEFIEFEYKTNGKAHRIRQDFDGLGTGQKTVMSILTTAAQRSTSEIGRLIIVDEIGDLVSGKGSFLDMLAQVLTEDKRFDHVAAMIFIMPSQDPKAKLVPRERW